MGFLPRLGIYIFVIQLVNVVYAGALTLEKKECQARQSTSSPDLTKLQTFSSKPRIVILTDLLNEPDDSMSLVRYLLYSNEFDTCGIVATTSRHLPNITHPEEATKIINAYGSVVDNLNSHVHPSIKYQSADELLSLIHTGPPVYGRQAFDVPLSNGSQLILDRLAESDNPLWVLAWGGTNTLAQALLHLERTQSAEDAAKLRSRLRVYAISDQDDTGNWIRYRYPDVFYIVSIHAYGDYYMATWIGIDGDFSPGTDFSIVRQPWLKEHIQIGPLGAVYRDIVYGMEGDTPSYLGLIQNGLGSSEHPDWGSWGGRYNLISPDQPLWSDTADTVIGEDGKSYRTNHATVWRWRRTFQNDFVTRMQWTLTSDFSNATHPAVVRVNGHLGPEPLIVPAGYNQCFAFDASETYDPDHPEDNSKLEFQWYQYGEPSFHLPGGLVTALNIVPTSIPEVYGTLTSNESGFQNVTLGQKVEVSIPSLPETATEKPDLHLILQVRSKMASFPVTRYQRIIFRMA
ncbi:hypothetical protein HYFRA_00013247 [Hymenoscyphus fraxineus]|uniref:Cellulose-binding protein n=1 Tax=Hymenoscyphus fraxineus TaxID=746836 RepID=A0A9N9Q0X6_9HELO|nr:hypothetical protein HYFRA_00013247 [Hymenoscyphus fraxineus]